jgi:hypothetical protein
VSVRIENAECFTQPHWRVIACGLQTEAWFNEGQGVGSGGIFNPRRGHLRVGEYYYRFASSTSSEAAQRGGGWWLDFENFRKIRSFAENNSYSLREAARLMLALPHAWTPVDLLIRAQLRVPLDAYAGEGKPAKGADTGRDAGTRWVPTQHVKVMQLYIPGLFIRRFRDEQRLPGQKSLQLYQSAFAWPGNIVRT